MILVIFDVDGTLVQSNKVDSQCFADTYQEVYGRPFPSIDWRNYPHVSDTTIFKTVIYEHFNRRVAIGEEAQFRQKFVSNIIKKRQETPHEFSEVPYAKRTIDNLLNDERFTVGIATGGWKAPALVKLNYVGIPSEELIISGADGKETREDIINETIFNARQSIGNINKIVYIGDAIWDITTTRNMNIPLIGIRRKGDLDFMYQRGVDTVFKDYKDYDAFVEGVLRLVK